MELDQIIEKLKHLVKDSEASDGNKHFNLGLVAAEKRDEYELALKEALKAIEEGKITREKFLSKVGIGS